MIICSGFLLFVFIVASLSGCRCLIADNHRTAQCAMLLPLVATPYIACTVFLRDVATSRHSPNKFGSALDLRNVINSLTPLG